MTSRIFAKDRVGTTVRGFKIIDYKRENNRTYFYVICPICGNEKWIRSDTINNPKVISCGCYNSENNYKKMIDISNVKFKRLVALEPTKKRDKFNGSIIWKCQCRCGNVVEASYHDLVSDRISSCGCKQLETRKNNMAKAQNVRNKYRLENTDVLALERSKKANCGVSYDKVRQKYRASITFQKKVYHLGRYDSYSEALRVRKVAEENLFENFLEWYYSKFTKNEGNI